MQHEPKAASMSTEHHHITSVSLPPESAIAKAYASMNLADAYSIELPTGASTNPELLARFIFARQAPGISIVKDHTTSPTEVVLGENDKHLDFRLSVLCSGQSSPGAKRHLILSTVVHCHNRLGRLYISLIAPFHRIVVQSNLRSAAMVGWPSATEA